MAGVESARGEILFRPPKPGGLRRPRRYGTEAGASLPRPERPADDEPWRRLEHLRPGMSFRSPARPPVSGARRRRAWTACSNELLIPPACSRHGNQPCPRWPRKGLEQIRPGSTENRARSRPHGGANRTSLRTAFVYQLTKAGPSALECRVSESIPRTGVDGCVQLSADLARAPCCRGRGGEIRVSTARLLPPRWQASLLHARLGDGSQKGCDDAGAPGQSRSLPAVSLGNGDSPIECQVGRSFAGARFPGRRLGRRSRHFCRPGRGVIPPILQPHFAKARPSSRLAPSLLTHVYSRRSK